MDALISMTGYVGGDVESRPTRLTQTSSATFRLACTPRVRRRGDWADGETTWMTVTCFRGLAENVAASVHKGDPVLVVGKLRTQSWRGDQGERHERVVLEATTVGHDLTRGTADFRKVERFVAGDDEGRELGELIASVEAAADDPAEQGAGTEPAEQQERVGSAV